MKMKFEKPPQRFQAGGAQHTGQPHKGGGRGGSGHVGMKTEQTPQRFHAGGSASGGSSPKAGYSFEKPPQNFKAGGAMHTGQPTRGGTMQRDSHPKQSGVNQAASGGLGYGIFNPPSAKNADKFRGAGSKKGAYTVQGGHMLGCKK